MEVCYITVGGSCIRSSSGSSQGPSELLTCRPVNLITRLLLTHLWFIKSHVVAHDVELHSSGTSVTFDPVSVEGQWVAQLVAQRQGEVEVPLLPEAVQHVQHCAAGRLVGLEEHDVGVGTTGAQRRSLSIRGQEDGACSRLDAAGRQIEEEFTFRSHSNCVYKLGE